MKPPKKQIDIGKLEARNKLVHKLCEMDLLAVQKVVDFVVSVFLSLLVAVVAAVVAAVVVSWSRLRTHLVNLSARHLP